MKKLLLGAAISAALFGGAAQAAITETGGFPNWDTAAGTPDTYPVFLSGASAPRAGIESLLTDGAITGANRLCQPGTVVYKFATPNNDQNAYLCELNSAVPALNALKATRPNVLFYKRNAGGSAMGVNPIVADAAISFMIPGKGAAPAGCALGSTTTSGTGANLVTLKTYNCPATVDGVNDTNMTADFGASDVDPLQFVGDNVPLGFTAVNPADIGVGKVEVKTAFAQIFNVPVSLRFRNALQDWQFPTTSNCNPRNVNYLADSVADVATKPKTIGIQPNSESATCQPNLTTAQLSSILSGKITSGKQIFKGAQSLYAYIAANNPSLLPGSPTIHVCSRTDGSGTKAQAGIKFENYPCSTGGIAMANDSGGLEPSQTFVDFALFGAAAENYGTPLVHQMASGGGVNECFNELDNGVVNAAGQFRNNPYVTSVAPSTNTFRWAVGVQGTDNNANLANDYRFIKINNEQPTALNVVNGSYGDWVELTFQYKTGTTSQAAGPHVPGTPGVPAASVATLRDFVISKAGLPQIIGILNNTGSGYGQLTGGTPNDPVFAAFTGNGTSTTAIGQGQHSWGTAGFLASPAVAGVVVAANGQYNAATPANPFSHDSTVAGTTVNNCRAPVLFDIGTAATPKGVQKQ